MGGMLAFNEWMATWSYHFMNLANQPPHFNELMSKYCSIKAILQEKKYIYISNNLMSQRQSAIFSLPNKFLFKIHFLFPLNHILLYSV